MTMKRIALVTGATSGIGEACARKLAVNGYNMIITGRKADRLDALAQELSALGVGVITLEFDVRDREAATTAIKSLPAEWQEIDVLVNNAGGALGLEPEYEGNYEDWDTMIDTNIKGLLTMTRLIVPGMVERNRGHVVNIGSVAGDAAYANGNVYCATKSAVKASSDCLRIDVAHTKFSVIRFHGDKERADGVYKGIQPLTGEDIAESVYFAVSAPEHVQVAEMLILATHQASGSVIHRQ